MTEKIYKSECCNAKVRVDGAPDFLGSKEVCTVHYVCLKCNKPCNVATTGKSGVIEVNVNDDIEIRLTREGRKIYREHRKKYRHDTLKRVNGRWVRIQLSDFMYIFGSRMFMGATNVIIGNVIRIPKS